MVHVIVLFVLRLRKLNKLTVPERHTAQGDQAHKAREQQHQHQQPVRKGSIATTCSSQHQTPNTKHRHHHVLDFAGTVNIQHLHELLHGTFTELEAQLRHPRGKLLRRHRVVSILVE